MDHRNNFNLLRLLAAAQVVLMHSYAHLHLPTNPIVFWVAAQFSGVACFFVISGFLVSDSYLRSPSNGSFFFKRAVRIYPALILNIAVLEALMYFAGQLPGASASYPVYFTIYALTASSDIAARIAPRMYSFAGFFHGYPSQVLWTLTVELSFYLVLPFFLSIAARWKQAALILAAMSGSFAIAFSADMAFYGANKTLGISVVPYFWVFGLGALARLYWEEIAFLFERKILLWLLIYGATIAIAIMGFGADSWLDYKLSPQWTGLFRIVTMGCVILSAAFSFSRLTQYLRLDKVDISYGLYLWHMLIVMSLLGIGWSSSRRLWFVVYGGGLLLAAISWFLVERPAQALKKMKKATPAVAT